MDQHLFLRLGARAPQVRAGDVVSFDLSHPCTAFDKFKLVYVVDDSYTVIDGILTFF
jgi:D-serine deaminase-like pyridoxal phosphate-dependent protein